MSTDLTTVEDVTVPASGLTELDAGAQRVDVPARLYRPSSADARAGSRGIVWVHGGGFVWGDLDMPEADWVARRLSAAGHTVLSVDYRLVTGGDIDRRVFADDAQHRFPAAHDDVRAALSWMAANAARLGFDPNAIALGGASAGGNLAAGVALRTARDPRGAAPARLVLAYPVAHAALPELDPATASAVQGLDEAQRFRPEAVAAMNLNYVGDEALLTHPFAFPGGQDLTGMPPTLIVNSEADDLRATGEAFARELEAAGIDTTCTYEPGTTHGHLNRPEEPHAERSLTTILDWLADGEHDDSRKDLS
ncbi:alpha/beta hydrolase [Demequina sp. NBRC 110056]|uniref:alpha/beta hydrolase n=1 Tax=Demequina sp. NBRC 110056 TaxID=1570345 RepID=UPI000A076012|nr:alpha/beta hydrolase [Demequina sp. NBRC 110056]